MEELKKCPFCGGKAVVKYDGYFKCYYVRCQRCYAETSDFLYGSQKEAIEAWNERVKE